MSTEEKIKSKSELYNFFFNESKKTRCKDALSSGVYVSSKIRKEVLTGDEQGKIAINGVVASIQFENLSSGVWRAFVEHKLLKDN